MKLHGMLLGAALAVLPIGAGLHAQAPPAPNIVVIMGDDIGWSNIGVYNQGVMSGRTPNLDRLANEGMRFSGDPRRGHHDRASPQGYGIRDRSVRQEPPGRPEQVPADGAWLRRVLRLPIP